MNKSINQAQGNRRSIIPNLFTLLNLFFGCMAIVEILQGGLVVSADENGQQIVELPQKLYIASVYIGIAAIIDFLDGFIARLLKAPSALGKQLDSLADVVSFGVAPGMIIYVFLQRSFAAEVEALDIPVALLLPAFIIPCAGAYRLARFNIDESQSHGFKGVPIPAAGLLIASFPLVYWFANEAWIIQLLQNKFFWYALIVFISYLMVSTLPMMALKFKSFTIKAIAPFIILLIVALISAMLVGWLSVAIVFILYVVLSLLTNKNSDHV
jgi:CDP-diacylglycerol---serine O-phosphatidyltransferase